MGYYRLRYQRPTMALLSPMVVMLEGLGFNLCVAPFLNVCVPNLPQGSRMENVGGGQSWVGGVVLELDEERLSQRLWRRRLMWINDNIQTSIKYRSCLLFKRLYAAGSAWLGQGLGTKVLAWNKERQEWGKKTICKRWEDHGDMGTDINDTWNAGMKDETRGTGTNGGVLEMWWK